MCNLDTCPVTQIFSQGASEPGLQELARRLRPDLGMNVRVFHLKQAVEQIGDKISRLEGYYCLCAVVLPYSWEDIRSVNGAERHYRQNLRCQIDLGVSAAGAHSSKDGSLEGTARRALREYCRVDIKSSLWAEEAQLRVRRKVGVDLPLSFWDGDTKVFVVILPGDVSSVVGRDGVRSYGIEADFGKAAVIGTAGRQDDAKSVDDWKHCQDEFEHLGKLPKPWIFIRSSRDRNIIYYLNTSTQETAVERPLPAGWTKHKSKSTGKTYYFHAERRKSIFEIPPPE